MGQDRKGELLKVLEGVRVRVARSRSHEEIRAVARHDRLHEHRGKDSEPLTEPEPGGLFMVGNKWLGIPRESKLKHPAAVVREGQCRTGLSKGSDAKRLRPHYASHYVLVEPDAGNGLQKFTAFDPLLRWVGCRRIFADDYLGRLSEQDFKRLIAAVDAFSRHP
ncbi:MAG: hypothetical protein ACLFVT_01945 [Syntrophobacteria bacterium]